MSEASPHEFAHHLRQVRAAEAAAHAFRDREGRRQAGVAWAGLSADPLEAATEDQLHTAAQARLAAAQAWRGRPDGGFLTAIAAVQRAAERLHAVAEQARAGASRGLDAERAHCAALVVDLRRQALDLTTGLRAAGRALGRPE
jgi:hypothetical protein